MPSPFLMPNTDPPDLTFSHGQGPWLYTTENEAYLDFVSGIAVNTLGHAHPSLIAALEKQARKLWHISNSLRIKEAEELAQRLTEVSFADRAFFCNSGAEAIECGIKAARRYFWQKGFKDKNRLITFHNAFHGRTLATIAAAGNPSYLAGFAPALDGFDNVPFNDIEAVKQAITPHTAGILLEPVQGEGGVTIAEESFLKQLRALCNEHDLLLIYDEVQCGIARTGHLFTYEWFQVAPDIICLAKGLGGGFPIGACLLTEDVAQYMVPGTHGSTFGGNPLAMSVGLTMMDIISQQCFLANVREMGAYALNRFKELADENPDKIEKVLGRGLMLGVQFKEHIVNKEVVTAAREERFLVVRAGNNVVRILPPLNVDTTIIDEGVNRLARTIRHF